jgi:integrase
MKTDPLPQPAALATLQDVLDRLPGVRGLSPSRARDYRSAVLSYAKLKGQPPATIPLDLADIRRTLDKIVPARAKVSAKRWSNLRSDLATAIHASGLRPMLKTGDLTLDDAWSGLLANANARIHHGLSRFARWASWRQIAPYAVDDSTIQRFVGEMDAASLIRNFCYLQGNVGKCWNALVALHEAAGLHPVAMAGNERVLKRVPWQQLPASFPEDAECYLRWVAVPDPLAVGARARALSPRTIILQRNHIHSAVTAAAAAGIALDRITSLTTLVELETFRALLRQLWQQDGRKLSAYTHGVVITLLAIASDWVKTPPEAVASLKELRRRLKKLPTGLTDKNKATMRNFDDPRLTEALIQLPDKLWHAARRTMTTSRYSFTLLQSALAIDILNHVPFRMENLSALKFDTHLHWPQGRHKPAIVSLRRDEVKNAVDLKFELPTTLAERLQVYRNEIAPAVTGQRPDAIFVSRFGKPRNQEAISTAIKKTIARYLGIEFTPHQFRHLTAKIILDTNPEALELVREMLGHTNVKTTKAFYAGNNTLRAGRAHAKLILKMRDSKLGRGRRRRKPKQED